MATANVNGVRVFYEISGVGEIPLVLVHGSWGSHHAWDLVASRLAESFRVVMYDRRGHSQSERPPGQGSVHEDVADLAALIEHLALGPAWVAGTSFGASITLRTAGEYPDIFRGLIAHEPPLFSLLTNHSLAPLLDAASEKVRLVAERIASGDHAGAAEQFVDTLAFGPGSWSRFPAALQQTFITNAPTYLDEACDPEQLAFDLASIRTFPHRALLTMGDRSPPTFAPVVAMLADAFPNATVHTFPGAGHGPHNSHPDAYVEAVASFVRGQPLCK